MSALSSDLRKLLANAIAAARVEAESGARRALASLAVGDAKAPEGMPANQLELRRRLRAHGCQLGDVRRSDGTQPVGRLLHEVAYEHWHRMLFARFLAESDLLIEPSSLTSVSLADVEELARDEQRDPWEMAAEWAQAMLPRIFRGDDPVLTLRLPREAQAALERELMKLPAEVFRADDSLGWTYQFWQAASKKAVNESGVKIGADELPAVTQLFTEHYMVLFLYHNTIGAWHAAKVLEARPELARDAKDEEELRRSVRLDAAGGEDWPYLRFVREGDAWRPAAGTYSGWPRRAAELRVLDPCCGSGHFLIAGLELLTRLRMSEEGLGLEEALRRVLAENLFGLELDARCTQIAAFNVALTAWKLAGRWFELPPLNVACSGLAVATPKADWLAMAGDNKGLRSTLESLHDLFQQAPLLGSLIDPVGFRGWLFREASAQAESQLRTLLQGADEEQTERAVAAQGMARAAEILAGEYTLVATNVPYRRRNDLAPLLNAFADLHWKEARGDLATLFLDRSFKWLGGGSTAAVVIPRAGLFKTNYGALRRRLLRTKDWRLLAALGPGAFQTITGEKVNPVLCIISQPSSEVRGYQCLDVSTAAGITAKAQRLTSDRLDFQHQESQLANPDARILTSTTDDRGERLASHAQFGKGSTTGDSKRFLLDFWELSVKSAANVLWLDSPRTAAVWGGRSLVTTVPLEAPELLAQAGCWLRGQECWGKIGIAVNKMSRLQHLIYDGEVFDDNIGAIVPADRSVAPAVLAYCESGEYTREIRAIDQDIKVTAGTLTKVPFDLVHWQRVAAEKYPNGLPEPESDDPTQWLFHGHPAKAQSGTELQVAVARLLGYHWPPEHDAEMRLSPDARAWVARSRALDAFADADGIVPLPPVRGERGADDRLAMLLRAAFGKDWSAEKQRALLVAADSGGKSLREWLRDDFFSQHCEFFDKRPFIWHVWDGNKSGFSALVSAHRLTGPNGEGRRTLEALTYSYLGTWIDAQRKAVETGEEGAEGRLASALELQKKLELILKGEPPYDLFIRWKPLHEQPIGWEPDVNDGIRMNIRPFVSAELAKGGRAGAGILRWKPGVKWEKDRGNDPASLRARADFPWSWSCPANGTLNERTDFHGGATFDGARWNDLHYTNAVKQAARERSRSQAQNASAT